jgi:DNA-binding response OmpR family regulator
MLTTSTVLVVDDEPFILEATARLLRGAGYDVHTCDQWAGVANIVRTASPQLVLLDYNMPTLKGDNVCMILKRTMADQGLRIVIHSSEPQSDLVDIVERCGADGYICKNGPQGELLNRVAAELALADTASLTSSRAQ